MLKDYVLTPSDNGAIRIDGLRPVKLWDAVDNVSAEDRRIYNIAASILEDFLGNARWKGKRGIRNINVEVYDATWHVHRDFARRYIQPLLDTGGDITHKEILGYLVEVGSKAK